ncbi:hypothetical protein TFLX_03154 [Thermoflexales bacterium]|nr:hypothetical protein TFLX_03154 [Thermoflexales bacterium]
MAIRRIGSDPFGRGNPIVDAKRVASLIRAPLPSEPGSLSGSFKRAIYLWRSSLEFPQVYSPDEAGFSAAIGDAVSGDSIQLPDGDLLLTEDYIVPAGVTLHGSRAARIESSSSVGGLFAADGAAVCGFDLDATDLTTGALVVGEGVLLEDMRIAGAVFGVQVQSACIIRRCAIVQSGGSGNDAALYVDGTDVKVQNTELIGANYDLSLTDNSSVMLDDVIGSTSSLGTGATINHASNL